MLWLCYIYLHFVFAFLFPSNLPPPDRWKPFPAKLWTLSDALSGKKYFHISVRFHLCVQTGCHNPPLIKRATLWMAFSLCTAFPVHAHLIHYFLQGELTQAAKEGKVCGCVLMKRTHPQTFEAVTKKPQQLLHLTCCLQVHVFMPCWRMLTRSG